MPSFERALAPVDGGQPFPFVTAPDIPVDLEQIGAAEVRITGHFDDPAANECVMEGGEHLADQAAESVRTHCRERFVVTSVEILGPVTHEPPVVGQLVHTLLDRVRLREEPGTDALLLGTLTVGARSYVADGPREADGDTWWLLAGPGIPPASGCEPPFETDPYNCPSWYGWAADASAEGDPWLAMVSPSCPPDSGTLTHYYRRQPLEYLACFGGESHTYKI